MHIKSEWLIFGETLKQNTMCELPTPPNKRPRVEKIIIVDSNGGKREYKPKYDTSYSFINGSEESVCEKTGAVSRKSTGEESFFLITAPQPELDNIFIAVDKLLMERLNKDFQDTQ